MMEPLSLIAEKLHEAWQQAIIRGDGVFTHSIAPREPLARRSYSQLPREWQEENMAAAEGAVEAVVHSATLEEAAEKIHENWLSRNDAWAPEALKLSYHQLSEVEKEKDRAIARLVSTLTRRPLASSENMIEFTHEH